MIDRVGGGFKDYAPLTLRLGLSIIFILQGAMLITDLGRRPSVMEIVTMVVQLLGGLFLLIGFMTRWAAFACGALMLWVIIEGPGFYVFYKPAHQLPFALLMMCIASYGLGGGKYSLDEKSKKKDG